MKLYRYFRDIDFNNDTFLILKEFDVIKETSKCYVIKSYCKSKKRYILKTQNGKRWAYTSKKEALNNFIERCKRSIIISKINMQYSNEFLKLAENLLKNNEYEN